MRKAAPFNSGNILPIRNCLVSDRLWHTGIEWISAQCDGAEAPLVHAGLLGMQIQYKPWGAPPLLSVDTDL